MFGNTFRPVAFDPRWRTSDVVGQARAICDDKASSICPTPRCPKCRRLANADDSPGTEVGRRVPRPDRPLANGPVSAPADPGLGRRDLVPPDNGHESGEPRLSKRLVARGAVS